jgi:hypothetical protein
VIKSWIHACMECALLSHAHDAPAVCPELFGLQVGVEVPLGARARLACFWCDSHTNVKLWPRPPGFCESTDSITREEGLVSNDCTVWCALRAARNYQLLVQHHCGRHVLARKG